MIVRSLVFALSFCLSLATASAHGPARGPHGGQVQDLAGGHVELVAQDNEIVVYLFDAENRNCSPGWPDDAKRPDDFVCE